tara:strand:+ start:2499 stop:2849 length:351 start_codon:yes stop_codon:yes gene_type:complete
MLGVQKVKLPDWNALNIRWNDYEEKIEVLENMVMDAIERPKNALGKLLLFDLTLQTHGWMSEYGCVFLVAAKDEAEARKLVEEDMEYWLEDGYDLTCNEVGFAHQTEVGKVSGFIT